MRIFFSNKHRIASKLRGVIFICIIVLGIYIYLFCNNLTNSHSITSKIHIPSIAGGIAMLISALFISPTDEWLGTILFSVAWILIGIYQGLQGSLRIITASISILLQFGAIGYFVKLHQIRKTKMQPNKGKEKFEVQDNFGFAFATLIILSILQIFRLVSTLLFPFDFYKSLPVWLVILGAGGIIMILWFSSWYKYKRLFSMLIASVIMLALSLVINGAGEWVINIILLLMLVGTAYCIASEYSKITGKRIQINKIPLFLSLLLLIIILVTITVSLFR